MGRTPGFSDSASWQSRERQHYSPLAGTRSHAAHLALDAFSEGLVAAPHTSAGASSFSFRSAGVVGCAQFLVQVHRSLRRSVRVGGQSPDWSTPYATASEIRKSANMSAGSSIPLQALLSQRFRLGCLVCRRLLRRREAASASICVSRRLLFFLFFFVVVVFCFLSPLAPIPLTRVPLSSNGVRPPPPWRQHMYHGAVAAHGRAGDDGPHQRLSHRGVFGGGFCEPCVAEHPAWRDMSPPERQRNALHCVTSRHMDTDRNTAAGIRRLFARRAVLAVGRDARPNMTLSRAMSSHIVWKSPHCAAFSPARGCPGRSS